MNIISRREAEFLGAIHFFTGKPCIYGHIVIRYVSNNRCFKCERIAKNKWRKKNPKKDREVKRKWRHKIVEASIK